MMHDQQTHDLQKIMVRVGGGWQDLREYLARHSDIAFVASFQFIISFSLFSRQPADDPKVQFAITRAAAQIADRSMQSTDALERMLATTDMPDFEEPPE